jgi:hypothetical protein
MKKKYTWLHDLICRLFHNIKTINPRSFVDVVTKKDVGEFECVKCNKKFYANKKNSWFRVYKK